MSKFKPECWDFDSTVGHVPEAYVRKLHFDNRGYFAEVATCWQKLSPDHWVKINHSHSTQGVLRGLHWQAQPHGVAKYVTCLNGSIEDVVVDLRKNSKTYGRWRAYYLLGLGAIGDRLSLTVPVGFAHGFLTLSKTADVLYIQSGIRVEEAERSLRFDDPDVGINWTVRDPNTKFVMSDKDQNATFLSELSDADVFT